MKHKLDVVRKRRRSDLPILELNQSDQIEAINQVKTAIEDLWQSINDKEEYDFDKLNKQLVLLNERLDFQPVLDKLEEIKPKDIGEVGIKDFTKLLGAVEKNKPLQVDFTKLEKAIIQVQQTIQESSVDSQNAEDFQPVRRVVKVGNRLVYDDQPTPSRGGGGGTTSSGSSSSSSSGDVVVTESVLPTGAATSAKQDTQQTTLDAIKTAVESVDTPTALVAFVTAVTTAGTRVQLASNAIQGGILEAPSTNTGLIYVGGATVSSSVFGAELQPGQSVGIAISNTNAIYIDSSVNGDKASFLGS